MDSNYSNPNRTVLTAVGLAAALGAAAYFGPKVIPSSANAQHINGGKGLAELIQSRRVNVDGGDNNTYNICGNIVATDDAEVIIQGNITINCSRDGEGRVVQRRTNTTGNYKPNTAEDTYFVGNQEIGTIKEFDPDTGKDVKYINRIEGKLDESKIIPGTYSVRLSSPTSENRGTVTIGANGDVLSADEATLNEFDNERNDNVYLIREEAGEVTDTPSSNPFIERINEVYVFGAGTGNETNLVGIVGFDDNRLYEASFVADELRDSLNNLRKTDTTLENGLCDALIYAGEQPNILAGTRLFESTLADSRTENRVLGGKGNEFDYVKDGHLNLTGTCDDISYETLRAGAISLGAAQAGNEQKINGAMLPNGRLETLLEMVPYHQTGDLNKDIENTILAAYDIVRSNGVVVGNGRTY